MTDLSGRQIELFESARAVAAADNRTDLVARQFGEEVVEQNQNHLIELTEMYQTAGFSEITDRLATVLGSRWSLGPNMLAADYIQAEIPQPALLGARRAEIDWSAEPDSSADVLAMHGEIIYYRTEQPSTDPSTKSYNERAFFVLFMQPKPTEYQSAAPLLCFGDLDDAKWDQEAHKLLLPIAFGNDPTLASQTPEYIDTEPLLASLTAEYEKRPAALRRKRVYQGILRSNQQPWMEEDKEISLANVQEAMQQFIDRWYDPVQTQKTIKNDVEATIPKACQEFLDNPFSALTFDVVKALVRYAPNRDGKLRHAEYIAPVVNSTYLVTWENLQKPLKEYPIYRQTELEVKERLVAKKQHRKFSIIGTYSRDPDDPLFSLDVVVEDKPSIRDVELVRASTVKAIVAKVADRSRAGKTLDPEVVHLALMEGQEPKMLSLPRGD